MLGFHILIRHGTRLGILGVETKEDILTILWDPVQSTASLLDS